MSNPRYAKDSANPIFDISDPNLDFFLAASIVDDAPKSYAAAMKSKDAKKWRQAACEEIEALLCNGTWEVVFFFFLFEADFIQLVVLNLSHLNYIKLCLFLTSNKR